MTKTLIFTVFFGIFALQTTFLMPNTPDEQLRTHIDAVNKRAKKLFGYNPGLMLIKNPRIQAPSDEIVVFFHGFGSSKGHALSFSKTFPCPIATFNFSDVEKGWHYTSLGQLPEVLQAAFIVYACHKAGYNKISLFGISRGGAAAINLCAALASDDYNKQFKRLGINTKEKQKMLEKIQAGSVVLSVPLMGIPAALKNPAVRFAFALISNYSVSGMRPLDSVKLLCQKKVPLKVMIHLQEADEIVPNKEIRESYELFKDALDEHQISFCADTENHNSFPSSLFFQTLHECRQRWNLETDPTFTPHLVEIHKKHQLTNS